MDRRVFLSRVAQLYYKEKLNQNEIAEIIGLSRSQISRILTEAENTGVVRIEVDEIDDRVHNLEEELKKKFELIDAIVTYRTDPSNSSIMKTIGRAAGYYLMQSLKDGDILGVASGRTLNEMIRFLRPLNYQDLKVIQLMGGGAGITAFQTFPEETVRNFSKALGGNMFGLHAPFIVESEEIKNIIMSTLLLSKVTNLWSELSIVVIGIGNLEQEGLLFKSGWLLEENFEELTRAKAVGAICGSFFDIDGNIIDYSLSNRVIAVPLESLKKVKYAIGVAGGDKKVLSLLAALKGKFINILITDDKTARELLTAK